MIEKQTVAKVQKTLSPQGLGIPSGVPAFEEVFDTKWDNSLRVTEARIPEFKPWEGPRARMAPCEPAAIDEKMTTGYLRMA